MGMQVRNHLQFGFVKPGAGRQFQATQKQFEMLQKETIALGKDYRPCGEEKPYEKRKLIIQKLTRMAVALEKMRRMTWFGDNQVKKAVEEWRSTLPKALDNVLFEYQSAGIDMLKRLNERLRKHGLTSKQLIQPIQDVIQEERKTIRMGEFGGDCIL
jgi:hypothetical protein